MSMLIATRADAYLSACRIVYDLSGKTIVLNKTGVAVLVPV